jgi:hypothetical protein
MKDIASAFANLKIEIGLHRLFGLRSIQVHKGWSNKSAIYGMSQYGTFISNRGVHHTSVSPLPLTGEGQGVRELASSTSTW